MEEPSKRFQLNSEDLVKIMTGAIIAIGGALLTYLSEIVLQIDFGAYTPTVVSVLSILINIARKLLAGK